MILYCYENKSNMDLEFIVNLFILLAQFHIHNFLFISYVKFVLFCSDFDFYISSIRLLKNKKSVKCLKYRDTLCNPLIFLISSFVKIKCTMILCYYIIIFFYLSYLFIFCIVLFECYSFCNKK